MSEVQVTVEALTLPTYREPEAEVFPMFAENRVHQRSSGNPYPNRVVLNTDRAHREDIVYQSVRLENEYLCVVLLPQLGGRIYSAYDKVNHYDFFYKQHVIKPALIGMLGSWVSGGVEFNWPCHHRPSTYMPTDYSIEREENGAVTVWMSENEPLDRMKGMVGVRLAPDEAVIETRMRLYNRTPLRHSFLWWENAAVPVNEQYRLFFPHDVTYVQFHYRKSVTTYPLASGQYNNIDMGENSVDIRLHKNTRRPTSYFCGKTRYNFFGGYDEGKRAGVVHVADRYTSTGKKMFTWAYDRLAECWENALTDFDGAYAELMAGSYSDDQPDFSWLEPYETKRFSQVWYPIGGMGVPDCATRAAAIRLTEKGVHLQTTMPQKAAVAVCGGKSYVFDSEPCTCVFIPSGHCDEVVLKTAAGKILLQYRVEQPVIEKLPETLPSLPLIEDQMTAQDLYLAGVHVEQYRDPAINPEGYFCEAIRRDPRHYPSLLALAREKYRLGDYEEALRYALRCRKVLTVWNNHPESGALSYLLGMCYEAIGEDEKAYDAYQDAHWNADTRASALARIAAIDGRRGDYDAMLEHADAALRMNADLSLAKAEAAVAAYHRGESKEASHRLMCALKDDRCDMLAQCLNVFYGGESLKGFTQSLRADPAQQSIDIALDLLALGEKDAACALLKALDCQTVMTQYLLAYALGLEGEEPKAALKAADTLSFGAQYPARAGEERVLRAVLQKAPDAVNALFGLGCLRYAKRGYAEAAALWERLLTIRENHVMALRCLAIAYFSHLSRREDALMLLRRALRQSPADSQLMWETAYVMTRLRVTPGEIAAFLEPAAGEGTRDDLILQRATALCGAGAEQEALDLLLSHAFVPCEGGEHAFAEPYMYAHHALGRKLMAKKQWAQALKHFHAAQTLPKSLGVGLWNDVLLVPHKYYEGVCLETMGKEEEALKLFTEITAIKRGYFTDINLHELPCYQALCHARLGHSAQAQSMLARYINEVRADYGKKDPGFYETTPFFISYTEDAALVRAYKNAYREGFALMCLPGRQEEGRERLNAADPANLYARLQMVCPVLYAK